MRLRWALTEKGKTGLMNGGSLCCPVLLMIWLTVPDRKVAVINGLICTADGLSVIVLVIQAPY